MTWRRKRYRLFRYIYILCNNRKCSFSLFEAWYRKYTCTLRLCMFGGVFMSQIKIRRFPTNVWGYMVALQSGQFDVFFFRCAGKRDSCAEFWFSAAVGFFAKHSSCLMLSAYNKYIYGKLICWYLPYMRFGLVPFGSHFLCPRLWLLCYLCSYFIYFWEKNNGVLQCSKRKFRICRCTVD